MINTRVEGNSSEISGVKFEVDGWNEKPGGAQRRTISSAGGGEEG